MNMILLQGKLTSMSTVICWPALLFSSFTCILDTSPHSCPLPCSCSHVCSSFLLAPLSYFSNCLSPLGFKETSLGSHLKLHHLSHLFSHLCTCDHVSRVYLTASSMIAPHCPGDIWGMLLHFICTIIVETIHIPSPPSFVPGLRPLHDKLFSLHDVKV